MIKYSYDGAHGTDWDWLYRPCVTNTDIGEERQTAEQLGNLEMRLVHLLYHKTLAALNMLHSRVPNI